MTRAWVLGELRERALEPVEQSHRRPDVITGDELRDLVDVARGCDREPEP